MIKTKNNRFSVSIRRVMFIDYIFLNFLGLIFHFFLLPYMFTSNFFNTGDNLFLLGVEKEQVLSSLIFLYYYIIHLILFFVFKGVSFGFKLYGLELVKSDDSKPLNRRMVLYLFLMFPLIVVNFFRMLFKSKSLMVDGIYDPFFKYKLVQKET